MSNTSSTIYIKWIKSTMMIGMDSRGKALIIGNDSESDPEWVGLKPSDLLLLAAASCTAYDVISILKKQREPVQGLEIVCTGEQLSDPPHSFIGIFLKYIIKGQVNEENLKKAIELSEEKYCSVISTLRPGMTIENTFEIIR